MLGLLEGKTVDLRVRERDDLDFLSGWFNDIDFWGGISPYRGADFQVRPDEIF